MKLAKSVNKWAASDAIAKLFEIYPPGKPQMYVIKYNKNSPDILDLIKLIL